MAGIPCALVCSCCFLLQVLAELSTTLHLLCLHNIGHKNLQQLSLICMYLNHSTSLWR